MTESADQLPGSVVDQLLALFTFAGVTVNGERMNAASEGVLRWKWDGDCLWLGAEPAVCFRAPGLRGLIEKGEIGRAKLGPADLTVYANGPVFGTVERIVKVTR